MEGEEPETIWTTNISSNCIFPSTKRGRIWRKGKNRLDQIKEWGHWDLNPDQRVSTGQGATLSESYGSTLQSIITGQQTRSLSFPYNWSPRGYRVTPYPHMFSFSAYASSGRAFAFSSSSCAISNAGYRVFSRRVSFFSCYFLFWDVCRRNDASFSGPVGTFGPLVRNFRTRGVWLRRPALYPG